MKKGSILFAILILSVCAFGQTKYKTYSNARFRYSISYPADLLTTSYIKDESNSGEIFSSKDKIVEMRVWGEYNAAYKTLKGQFNEDINNSAVNFTYKVLLKNGFVISGFKGDKIYYQKTIRRKLSTIDVFYTFTIEYKKSDRQKLDKIVQKIAGSFKFDPNADV